MRGGRRKTKEVDDGSNNIGNMIRRSRIFVPWESDAGASNPPPQIQFDLSRPSIR
jgi:hypothetical protein